MFPLILTIVLTTGAFVPDPTPPPNQGPGGSTVTGTGTR
jgi:hypothetical protein